MAYQSFFNSIYKPQDVDIIIDSIKDKFSIVATNKKEKYYNIPCAFDIETSSFYRDSENGSEKVAIMYAWAFGICDKVILGREWEDFIYLVERIQEILNLSCDLRLICYVHNLAFDFSFFHPWIKFTKVFSISSRKPVYALTDTGIEFRCSYLLSGKKLELLGEDLRKYKVSKLVGDLKYDLIRHRSTILTKKEMSYISNDVRVILSYIRETIEREGNNICNIPLTKTGYVRRYCRDSCFFRRRETP